MPNEPGWVDNHCHLPYDRLPAAEVGPVLDAARVAGVHTFITVGCDLAGSENGITAARQHEGLWATVGLHPHEAKHGLDGLEPLLPDPNVVAVGECGLDYHYDHSPRDEQRAMFAAQIDWAKRHDLAFVIHTRDAWAETFDILDAEGVPDRTVFHCFTGGASEARQCLDRGGSLSFSGIVTFPSADDVREAAALCPADRLLVETDSPFLAPVPHRGRRNEPAHVAVVGAAVAAVRGDPIDAVAEATTANARRLYRLPVSA